MSTVGKILLVRDMLSICSPGWPGSHTGLRFEVNLLPLSLKCWTCECELATMYLVNSFLTTVFKARFGFKVDVMLNIRKGDTDATWCSSHRVTLIKILCIGLGCDHPVQPYVYQTSLMYYFLCFKPTEKGHTVTSTHISFYLSRQLWIFCYILFLSYFFIPFLSPSFVSSKNSLTMKVNFL